MKQLMAHNNITVELFIIMVNGYRHPKIEWFVANEFPSKLVIAN